MALYSEPPSLILFFPPAGPCSLLDILDLLPLPLQILLPQADLVITAADSKDVAA